MLGYVQGDSPAAADAALADLAGALIAEGWPLAGVVQARGAGGGAAAPGRRTMALDVLHAAGGVRLGREAGDDGCRMDARAMDDLASDTARALDDAPWLLIVNKFGRTEAAGSGFAPVIARALAAGVPVLTAIAPHHVAALEGFADGQATALPADSAHLLDWARAQRKAAAG